SCATAGRALSKAKSISKIRFIVLPRRAVIVRESGRSSDTGCPAFAGHDKSNVAPEIGAVLFEHRLQALDRHVGRPAIAREREMRRGAGGLAHDEASARDA